VAVVPVVVVAVVAVVADVSVAVAPVAVVAVVPVVPVADVSVEVIVPVVLVAAVSVMVAVVADVSDVAVVAAVSVAGASSFLQPNANIVTTTRARITTRDFFISVILLIDFRSRDLFLSSVIRVRTSVLEFFSGVPKSPHFALTSKPGMISKPATGL